MPYSIVISLFVIEFALIGPIFTSFILITRQVITINASVSITFPLPPPLPLHRNTPLLHPPVIYVSLNYISVYHSTILPSIPFTSKPFITTILMPIVLSQASSWLPFLPQSLSSHTFHAPTRLHCLFPHHTLHPPDSSCFPPSLPTYSWHHYYLHLNYQATWQLPSYYWASPV